MSDTYAGIATPSDWGSQSNILAFIARIIRNEIWTATIAKVTAVDTSAKTVDIIPDVNQIDGSGNPWPHETIHGCPYMYWQGGVNALQIDPAIGDHGAVIFASHDISSVIANKAQSNPGSYRRYDPSDGMYLGALPGLNPAATQTIAMNGDGITMTSTIGVTINADVIVNGSITSTGDVVADGISVDTHTHSGVTSGSDDTGEPNP